MIVRYFKYDTVNGEVDVVEVKESEFLKAEGLIEYERHTIFQNGVNQICLTKTNGYK